MNKDYFWNTLAGVIEAAEAVIISIIVTHVTHLIDAGYFTIAFAIGNLFMSIGKYGMYGFQVTDKNADFTDYDYFISRIVTVSIMVICYMCYLSYCSIFYNFPISKSIIILGIGFIYMVESFEDLKKAKCQQLGKLYAGAIMFVIRWICILIVFLFTILVTKNASLSIVLASFFSLFVFIICNVFVNSKMECTYKKESSISFKTIVKLLKTCFPLFLYGFLSFYVTNVSKYAIEKYRDASIQACFGFVSMPVFIISLLSGFLYQPQLVPMSEEYNNRNFQVFRNKIFKQIIIICVISIICIIVAYHIGIPFLSYIYNTDLKTYKKELIILLCAGSFFAISSYQSVIIIVMRIQKSLLYGYIPTAILSSLIMYPATRKYGTIGSAFVYMGAMILLSIIFCLFIIYHFRVSKKNIASQIIQSTIE